MSINVIPVIQQAVQEKLSIMRTAAPRFDRTSWIDPDTLGWNNITIPIGGTAPNAFFPFDGAQHVQVMVINPGGPGSLQVEFAEFVANFGAPLTDTVTPVVGTGLIRFGLNGDFLVAGLHASYFNVVPMETGGVSPLIGFTAGIYVTAY